MKAPLLLLLLFMLPSLSHGAMYKWTNSAGEIIYSDTPPNENTEEIILPKLTTTPAVKYKSKPKSQETPEEKTKATSYSSFKLLAPVKDAIIRDNGGNVQVNLSLKPSLDTKAGHSISIMVDGTTKISNSKQATATLSNIDRGTHTVSAKIQDSKGKVLKTSNSVSFTVYRYSQLHNKKPPPPPPAN